MFSFRWRTSVAVFFVAVVTVGIVGHALAAQGEHRIILRSEWGADDSLLFRKKDQEAVTPVGEMPPVSSAVIERQKACDEMQKKYPDEFRITQTITEAGAGSLYRWPLQYAQSVSLIIVHHTALPVGKEKRSGTERMRALYQYHASSQGWGDIGYHYVIDESGEIYEGRMGGKNVVGGHAFCNNIGTIGIALMGNFENEQPTKRQIDSLQWLAAHLASENGIDLHRAVTFHGKTFSSPIIRHRDVLSTACPGYYLATAFPQIVKNVQSGNISAPVVFQDLPPEINVSTALPTQQTQTSGGPITAVVSGLQPIGGRAIRTNPGGTYRFDMQYTAPLKGARGGSRIAQVVLSSPAIRLSTITEDGQKDVRGALVLPQSLDSGETYTFSLLLSAPTYEGTYWFEIGGTTYSLQTAGRRSRLMTIPTSYNIFTSPLYTVPLSVRAQPVNRAYPTSSARNRTRTVSAASSSAQSVSRTSSPSTTIRVRLTVDPEPILGFTSGASANGTTFSATTALRLERDGASCRDTQGSVKGDVLRFSPLTMEGLIQVSSDTGKARLFRGILECRIVDGALVLINELPLEDYLKGLSEEPDTEPYEKQRAFAIAARSYAASYLGSVRKFPGKPYDASDSPALFQSYSGVIFERANRSWVQAVESTTALVLWANGSVVRAPYFSSDDGRTRSPAEAGWPNFPLASIFTSKDDPWCRGQPLRGHGVGMSGCGAEGQAHEGKSGEAILQYYYPGTTLQPL